MKHFGSKKLDLVCILMCKLIYKRERLQGVRTSAGSSRVKDAKLTEFFIKKLAWRFLEQQCQQRFGLLSEHTAPRRAGSTTWASALCAQPTSVGWLCKEIIKIFRLRGRAGPRSNPIWVQKEGVRPYVWSRHAVLKALTQPFLRFVVNLKCKRSSGARAGLAVAFFQQKKTFALNRLLQYQ